MSDTEKIRENRLRRAAQRQGLNLVKSRARDQRALTYGGYMIVNDRNVVEAGGDGSGFSLTLDQVAAYLRDES